MMDQDDTDADNYRHLTARYRFLRGLHGIISQGDTPQY